MLDSKLLLPPPECDAGAYLLARTHIDTAPMNRMKGIITGKSGLMLQGFSSFGANF